MTEPLDVSFLPYMPLHIDRLRKSRAWLRCRRRPELGFYLMNLWMAAFHEVPAGSLEDDDDVLADAAMCDPDKWAAIKSDVLAGWERRDDRVWHSTVTEIATDSVTKLWKNRSRTEAARAARAQAIASATQAGNSVEGNVTVPVTEFVTDNVTEDVTAPVTDVKVEGRSKKVEVKKTSSNDDVVAADAKGGAYAFEANTIRLTEKDLGNWRRAFPHLSLEAELWALDDWAGSQKASKWFPAVSSALAKKEREAVDRVNVATAKREQGGDGKRPSNQRI